MLMPREQSCLELSKTQRKEEEKNEEALGSKGAKNPCGHMNFSSRQLINLDYGLQIPK